MIGIFDVGYDGEVARVGCVSVDSLLDDSPSHEWVVSGIPIFVTTAGYDLTDAKQQIVQMAGQGRIPSLLRRADRLSRSRV